MMRDYKFHNTSPADQLRIYFSACKAPLPGNKAGTSPKKINIGQLLISTLNLLQEKNGVNDSLLYEKKKPQTRGDGGDGGQVAPPAGL